MVHSDFEAQENKICHYFHFSPFYFPWSGPHTFIFWSLCFKRSLIWGVLTTSNLPWFMDLTNIPGSYAVLFFTASDFTFTTGHIHSWALFPLWHSALHSSPVAYWTPSNLGGLIFPCHIFCLFILFMGFSRQEYWSGLPFPPPVDMIFQNSPLWPWPLDGSAWHGS